MFCCCFIFIFFLFLFSVIIIIIIFIRIIFIIFVVIRKIAISSCSRYFCESILLSSRDAKLRAIF